MNGLRQATLRAAGSRDAPAYPAISLDQAMSRDGEFYVTALRVITMTSFRRPQYTREVLSALAKCVEVGDWVFAPTVEPGHEEVIAAFEGWTASECRLAVNSKRLGLNRNTNRALSRARDLGATSVVHLEDDTVLSPDALVYFRWAIEDVLSRDPAHRVLLASGYNKPPSMPLESDNATCDLRAIWSPWGWGVDGGRLEWMLKNWSFGNAKCFTCSFRSRFRSTRLELFPRLSRVQNIGYEAGENGRTPEWYRNNHRTPWVAELPVDEFRLSSPSDVAFASQPR